MAAFIDLSRNYSFFSIPAAFALAFVPKVYGSSFGLKYYDYPNPWTYAENIRKDDKLLKTTKNKLLRCEAAHANAMQTFPVFVGAVLAAYVTDLPVRTTNLLTFAYLVSRGLYTYAYVSLQDNSKLAPLRTLFWNAGVACWFTIFIKAGVKVLDASS